MDRSSDTSETRFASIVATMLRHPDVTYPTDATGTNKRFGSATLKVNGKVFAMLVKGKLVVKLPRARVEALLAAGLGTRFDPGHGRLMREWIAVPGSADEEWLSLAAEAMDFVGSKR